MKAIVSLIYYLLEIISAFPEVIFIMLLMIVYFVMGGVNFRNENEKLIRRMNLCRYTADKLTDDELMEFIEKKSIGEFARIGYMAAFADRYPLRKNLLDCKSPKK